MKHNKYSNLKIFGFPEKIRSFREGRITAPIYVRIKPTNRCSHACHWCVYSDGHTRPKDRPELHLQSHMHETMRERDMMPLPKALELLEDLGDMGTKAVTFSGGGEPLIHPHIEAIMCRALDCELDLSIITNGQSLVAGKAEVLRFAKWVRVSMDYTSAEEMAASRNVPERFFSDVMSNILAFAGMKQPDCDLGVNFIVTRENHLGLCEFASTLKSLGVENIRFSPVYVEGFQEYHAPIREAVEFQLKALRSICTDRFTINSSYDLDSASKIPHRPFTRCLYMQTVPVVGADLNVYACHNTAYSEHGKIGSIAGQRFRDLWFSPEARARFDALNPSISCRHECANHSKVDLFNRLAESSSDNFV